MQVQKDKSKMIGDWTKETARLTARDVRQDLLQLLIPTIVAFIAMPELFDEGDKFISDRAELYTKRLQSLTREDIVLSRGLFNVHEKLPDDLMIPLLLIRDKALFT